MIEREVPDGYLDMAPVADVWRYGILFEWSTVYDCWLHNGKAITVKPNVSVDAALSSMLDEHRLSNARRDYALFEPT